MITWVYSICWGLVLEKWDLFGVYLIFETSLRKVEAGASLVNNDVGKEFKIGVPSRDFLSLLFGK